MLLPPRPRLPLCVALACLLACTHLLALAAELPRVTEAELMADVELRKGNKPFILVGAMAEWDAPRVLGNVSYLAEAFPDAIVDEYRRNLNTLDDKPFLVPMSDVVSRFLSEPQAEPEPDSKYDHARYLHWRMHLPEWRRTKKLMEPMPRWFRTDQFWMSRCIAGKSPKAWPLDNFIRTTHWKIIVFGETNSSMFFHSDAFSTSTFVMQFHGRKKWTVCSPTESHLFYRAGEVDTFDPDLEAYPRFGEAKTCTTSVVHPGEIIFYPAHYWHQTLCLDSPTVSMAGRRIDSNNWADFAREIQQRCDHPGPDVSKMHFGAAPNFSPANCKRSLKKCRGLWNRLWGERAQAKREQRRQAKLTKGRAEL